MSLWFSNLFQNTRERYNCEPAECEEDELLDILVVLKLLKVLWLLTSHLYSEGQENST